MENMEEGKRWENLEKSKSRKRENNGKRVKKETGEQKRPLEPHIWSEFVIGLFSEIGVLMRPTLAHE